MANEKAKAKQEPVVEVKTEGKVKRWWRKHKGAVKVIIGGTVLAGAAVALAKYVRDHYALAPEDDEDGTWYIPIKKEVEHVTTVQHKLGPTKMLLDSDSPLAKFGVEDYDLYSGAVEFMQDEYGPLKISDIGDLGQAVKETCPDISDDSTVWCLLNVARDVNDDECEDAPEEVADLLTDEEEG